MKIKLKLFLLAVYLGVATFCPVRAGIKEDSFCLTVAPGIFMPSKGTMGPGLKVGGSYALTNWLLVGGGLRYKNISASYFEVDNVPIQSFGFTTDTKILLTQGKIQPYIGAEGGYSIYSIDKNAAEKKLNEKHGGKFTVETDRGGSLELNVLAGINYELNACLLLFTELKYGVDWTRSKVDFKEIDEDLGGAALSFGATYLF